MAYEFQPEAVTAILLSDGQWHGCSALEPVAITGQLKWPASFRFKDTDNLTQDRWVTIPSSSILAVKTRYIPTPEELAAAQAEREAKAEHLFEYQHLAPSGVYMPQAEAQEWACDTCKAPLENSPHTHYDAARKVVLCQNCTPYKLRYGDPT
jgi:hypothetical protein